MSKKTVSVISASVFPPPKIPEKKFPIFKVVEVLMLFTTVFDDGANEETLQMLAMIIAMEKRVFI